MPENKNVVVGICWWSPEQWDRLKEISIDGEELDNTFAEWQRSVAHGMKTFRRKGVKVARIRVDLDELIAWCEEQKMPLDGKARAKYAHMKLTEKMQ